MSTLIATRHVRFLNVTAPESQDFGAFCMPGGVP